MPPDACDDLVVLGEGAGKVTLLAAWGGGGGGTTGDDDLCCMVVHFQSSLFPGSFKAERHARSEKMSRSETSSGLYEYYSYLRENLENVYVWIFPAQSEKKKCKIILALGDENSDSNSKRSASPSAIFTSTTQVHDHRLFAREPN